MRYGRGPQLILNVDVIILHLEISKVLCRYCLNVCSYSSQSGCCNLLIFSISLHCCNLLIFCSSSPFHPHAQLSFRTPDLTLTPCLCTACSAMSVHCMSLHCMMFIILASVALCSSMPIMIFMYAAPTVADCLFPPTRASCGSSLGILV